jgi:hypothetical protein
MEPCTVPRRLPTPQRRETGKRPSQMFAASAGCVDSAMAFSVSMAAVALTQAHSARAVQRPLHPTSMFLPIASLHLPLQRLLTSSDLSMADPQTLAFDVFLQSAPLLIVNVVSGTNRTMKCHRIRTSNSFAVPA